MARTYRKFPPWLAENEFTPGFKDRWKRGLVKAEVPQDIDEALFATSKATIKKRVNRSIRRKGKNLDYQD